MGALKLLIKELLKKCKPWNTSGSLSQRNKTGNYYRKKNSTIRKQTVQLKKYRKGLNRHTDGKRQIKICTAACVIRELQIKIIACHYTSLRMAKIQNTDITKC